DFCSITSQYGSIEGNFFSDEEHRQALQLLLAKSVHEFGPDHILEINELSSLNEYTPAGVYVKSLGFKYDFIIKDMQNNKIWRAQVNLNTGVDSSPEEIWHALAKKVVVRMQKDGLIRCPEAAE
ncbi:MAG TPA: hypothetical protein VMV79_05945, partial [Alphaproteobacteria bacterium]|nr:hypothetical protein [Alphaproteobacteria bacterium]